MASAAEATVDMVDFAFDPLEIVVEPGDTVTWVNHDFEAHTATADDGSWSVHVDPGQSASITFSEAGTVPYFCKFHGGPGGGGMAGTVQVGAPPPPPAVDRLSATDNVRSAVVWSRKAFPGDGSARFAVLARADLFADSLASGGVLGKLDGPLLLTDKDSLSTPTRTELERLGVRQIYVLGGTAAVSEAVVATLESEGYAVRRISGSDRISTAVKVAEQFYPGATSAILARAFGDADPTRAFADSLGASAYAASTRQPILMTSTDRLSTATKTFLTNSAIEVVTVVGGEAAVSAAVVAELEKMGLAVERFAGESRAGTAAVIAETVLFGGDEDSSPAHLVLLDGTSANAWAAGFPAAAMKSPVLLTAGGELTDESMGLLIGSGNQGLQLVCAPQLPQRACDRGVVAASAAPDFSPTFRVGVMDGANDNGDAPAGDPNVTGLASVRGTSDPRVLCYDYFSFTEGLEVTAAHIHAGAAGVSGSAVVPLATQPNGWEGPDHVVNCAFDLDSAVVKDILANPTDYYLNVHTPDFPAGAMRGQLHKPSALLGTPMSGEAENPPGDPNGGAFGMVLGTEDPAELCVIWFFVDLSEEPTAAHIHEAPPGESGPAVITLPTPNIGAGPARCQTVDAAAFDAVKANPSNYYMNIHTATYPKGAVRGQLADFAAAFG